MNQNFKFMTVEEFMNTMKRRGTADSTGIKIDLPSPSSFKRKLEQKDKSYQKQQIVLQKLSSQTNSAKCLYNHYYIQEGVNHPRSPLKISSSNSISLSSEKQIKEFKNETLQQFELLHPQKQQGQQIQSNKSHFVSIMNLRSQKEIIDPMEIQQDIINSIHCLYNKQRYYSPPQQKRDLVNLEDYFKKSRNYQTMNKLIRKNSCECNNCGGKCNRIQSMKGVIPQFIPRQVIRDSLRKKWKKASKTLRKLCFFFKLAAGGHTTKPKNIRQNRPRNITIANNQIVHQALSAMSNQVGIHSSSNENIRQILNNDPYYPPFLNLKGGVDHSNNYQQDTLVTSSSIMESPTKLSLFKKNDSTNLSIRSINKPEDVKQSRSNSSSDSSFDQKDIASPSQIRKKLNKVDDNFLKELSQIRNIREKTRKATNVLARSDSRKKTQNLYSLYVSQQKNNTVVKAQDYKKQKIQTAYSRYLAQPHPKLIDIVIQRAEQNQSGSHGNFTKSQQLFQSKSQTKQISSPFMSPNSKSTKINFLENPFNSQSKSAKKSEYFTDRKKSSEIINNEDTNSVDSYRQMQKNFDDIRQQNNIKKQEQTNRISEIINQTPKKTINDSVLSKSSLRNEQSKSLSSSQTYNLMEIYKGNLKKTLNRSPFQNYFSSTPREKKNTNLDQKNNNNSQTNSQISLREEFDSRNTALKKHQNSGNKLVSNFEQSVFKSNKQKKFDKNQLKIFDKNELNSLQQDLKHLRVRSLNLCQNQSEYFYKSSSPIPMIHKPSKSIQISNLIYPDYEDNLCYQNSKRSLTRDQETLPPLSMSQSKTFKEDDQPSSILKKQTFKKTQTINIRFDV